MSQDPLKLLIGNNLRQYRLENNYTQEELAEKIGISTSFYANIERGAKSMSIQVLRNLTDALQISADRLLYEETASVRVQNIVKLLEDKPTSFCASIERFIKFYEAELANNTNID